MSTTSHAQVAVRLEQKVIDRIDKAAEKMSKRAFGSPFNRTDIIRLALEKGLEMLEKEMSPKGRR